jgi:sodium transport system ATP-binding protein
MLKVNSLTRSFFDKKRGEFLAVNNLSFEAAPGQVFGLLGPNGAGKTTTLRMVAQILKPTSGTITLDEKPLDMSPASRKQIGFLSGSTGLYERLTPREILIYFARLNGYVNEQLTERIDEVISSFVLKEVADTRCEKLSTGMRQRVSIARSVVHDPRLIILDEPTSGLDVIAKQAIYKFIETCKSRVMFVVFSTHLMNEAEKLCDQIGILHRGQLFSTGTLESLREATSKHYLEDIFLSIVHTEAIDDVS